MVFFAVCIGLIIHLVSSPPDSNTVVAITTYSLIYGGLFLVWEIYKHRNDSAYKILPSRVGGAILGSIAGFYYCYLIYILVGISNGIALIESSSIIAICFGSAEAGHQIGSFLGNEILLA